jgi:putative ABC transport system permease protein
LRAQGRQSAGELGGRLSGGLLVAQVALSLVLIVAAGLLGRTFASLVTRDKGFDPRQVLVVNIDSTGSTLRPAERASVYERARHAVGSVPGVSDAALSFATPIVTGPMLSQPIRSVAGGPELRIGQPNTIAALNTVSPGWFRAMGIRILAGRDVAENDRQNTPAVALVNQAFAQKFVSGVNPVGQTITLWLPGPPPSPVEIVGLVSDAVYGTLRNAPPPTLYMPISQLGGPWLPFLASVNMIVHGRFAAGSLSRAVAAAIASVHPGLVLKSHTLDEQLSASLTQERVLAMLSGSFAALALLLAALGLYGVAAYSVSRRRREFGIRMALGAAPSSIARLATHRIAVLVVLGIAAGAGVSAWATRFIGTLLYNLEPRDPQTLAGAAVVLVVVAGLAAWLPARRASRIDPAEVLRES